MLYINLHPISKNEEEILVPLNIEFEGFQYGHTTIWWFDENNIKHSAIVQESPDKIKEKIANKEFVDRL